MGKISIRVRRKRRSSSARSPYERQGGSSTPVENPPEPRFVQQPWGSLTPCSPSTLSANLLASGGSHVSAPALYHSNVSGDVNILLVKDVTQSSVPAISEDKALKQEAPADGGNLSRTILKTPKKIKIKAQINSGCRRGRPKSSKRGTKVCKKLFGVRDQSQPALGDGNEENRECVDPPGERSITGEVTGCKVTADYRCSKCGAGISSFEAKDHSVKCTQCMYSWKCARLKCTCTAEITIELPERTDQTVVLTDPLLRSILNIKAKGHCNTDTVQDEVISLGMIRVDFKDGQPDKVVKVLHTIKLSSPNNK